VVREYKAGHWLGLTMVAVCACRSCPACLEVCYRDKQASVDFWSMSDFLNVLIAVF